MNEASPNLFCPNCSYALDGWVEPRLRDAEAEGVRKMRDLAIQDWSAGKVYSRQTVNAWLRGLTARLLAKEEL